MKRFICILLILGILSMVLSGCQADAGCRTVYDVGYRGAEYRERR